MTDHIATLRACASASAREDEAPLVIHRRIVIAPEGTFDYADDGRPALVAPVLDREDMVVDLVAWFGDRPVQWWLRRGDQTPLLGARNLAMASWWEASIRVWATPAEQIKSGYGVVILDWQADLRDLFDGVRLVVAPPELVERLRANWRRGEPTVELPEIRVSELV